MLAAPATRRLARELNVDLQSVRGTGPAGRVTSEDVRNTARPQAVPAAPVQPPVQKEAPHGQDRRGQYRASLYAKQKTEIGAKVYHVGSDNRVAWWVETGSHHHKQKGRHILLHAAQLLELKVTLIARRNG